MTRLHIPPKLDGRTLGPKQRAAMLMREGELWLTREELAERRRQGEDLRVVAMIWHGEYGSILRGPRDHLEGCAPASESALGMRSHES